MEEQFQRVYTPFPQLPVVASPAFFNEWFISNLIRRVFAELVAQSGSDLVRLQAESNGSLHSYVTNEPPGNVDTYLGTSGDTWSTYQAFDDATQGVILIAEKNGLDVSLRKSDGSDMDTIYVPADTGLSLAIKSIGFRVKSHSAGNASDYEIIAVI